MAEYSYQAVTSEGEIRDGLIDAVDKDAAVEKLQRQGLIPMTVDAAPEHSSSGFWNMQIRLNRSNHQQILQFTQDLSTLIQAGIALDRALEIMASVTSGEAQKQMIDQIQQRVRKGQALSVAMAGSPDSFSPFYLNMVQASEAAGDIGAGLQDLTIYLERSQDLREKTLSALIYPIILLLVAAISLIIILVYVVPQFEQLFSDMGQALPLATRIVIASARGLTDYGLWLALVLLILGFYIRHLMQTPAIRLSWDKQALRLPLWGNLNTKLEVARFSRSLGTLVMAGVPLLNALKIARDTLMNHALIEEIEATTKQVQQGSSMAEPLSQSEYFPPLMLQMIQVGEETGQLDRMLLKIADVYDRQLNTAIQRTLTILEPALIVGLGILIAGIIISLLVAILSINQLPL